MVISFMKNEIFKHQKPKKWKNPGRVNENKLKCFGLYCRVIFSDVKIVYRENWTFVIDQ